MADARKDKLAKEFNVTIKSLITILEKRSRSDEEISNLDRLRKRINLLNATMGDSALLLQATPYFEKYAEEIITRNEKFFTDFDVKSEISQIESGAGAFILALTSQMKNSYMKANQTEKNNIYRHIKILFESCAEYNTLC